MILKNYFIIDDDEDDRDFLVEALTHIDSSVVCVTATNGMEGLKYLESKGDLVVDVIFLDQNMPGISGRQCLVNIKQNPLLCGIPVIIYSTSFDKLEIKNIMEMGAYWFLVKKASFTDLVNELKAIIESLEVISLPS